MSMADRKACSGAAGFVFLLVSVGAFGAPLRTQGLDAPIQVSFVNAYQGLYADNEKASHGDPNNPDKTLIRLLRGTTGTLDVCVFEINENSVVAALVQAVRSGVQVRIVTETDNMHSAGNPAEVRPAIQQLRAAGIVIRDDRRPGFMHHKFVVADRKAVWFGSMNFTSNSMFRDNNNGVLIRSPKLAADFEAEFNRLFVEGLFGPNPHVLPYPVVQVGDVSIEPHFSPEGGTKQVLLDELAKAKYAIRFMAFAFTDPDIGQLLLSRSHAGLQVEGVFDDCMIDWFSRFRTFFGVLPCWRDGNQAIFHHKVLIIDEDTVITGSFNFSHNAEMHNNEDCVVLRSKEIAGLYIQEYERVRYAAEHNTNLPPYNHPACRHKIIPLNRHPFHHY
jgi:phosphatidylserine/phosphatidylglycerophosphate/cardiolipin synthase-like enzyme